MTPKSKAIELQTKQVSEQVTMLPDGAVEVKWQDGKVVKYLPEQVDKEVKILRWTGLKDKNGTMIYEGDIFTDRDGLVYHILWDPEQLQYCLRWLAFVRGGQDIEQLSEVNWSETEVFGNILLWSRSFVRFLTKPPGTF